MIYHGVIMEVGGAVYLYRILVSIDHEIRSRGKLILRCKCLKQTEEDGELGGARRCVLHLPSLTVMMLYWGGKVRD